MRARVTDAFGNALAGQTVSVTAGNSATVASTVTTKPDGTVEISVPVRRGEQYSHRNHQQQQSEPERDVCRGCQDGEDRGSGGH
ncbi:Ig-like domain-containing protein [Escherichia coli]|uniref:Ig-like domain-containing protein n=1 Tax=Escherichia coli TaxID=562 RepID=UPI00210ED7B6|nr:Ig-like domain-containing protein [Escherichia coli]